MVIKRDNYLKRLVDAQWNGLVKVITGVRRCGKSYLLHNLFRDYLLEHGVKKNEILSIRLDFTRDVRYRNPFELVAHVRSSVAKSRRPHFLFVDEIQLSDKVANPYSEHGVPVTFYDALNELKELPNLDVYVTGSNSRMLSSDILTEFRGRSHEIRMHPLSFSEYHSALGGDKRDNLETYETFGGMPLLMSMKDDTARMDYLKGLFQEVYFKDIVERRRIERPDILEGITDLVCSSVGSLTNPKKITDTINTKLERSISGNTVKAYLDSLVDAFLFTAAQRYDVRGKSYFDYPSKFYCEDVGLRNARIGFRQLEKTHLMENVVFNELAIRGYSVDVGVVPIREKDSEGSSVRKALEIDFVATKGSSRMYIQSAFAMPDEEKVMRESRPLSLTGDSFPKIIVRADIGRRWYDEQGILNIGVTDFLIDEKWI